MTLKKEEARAYANIEIARLTEKLGIDRKELEKEVEKMSWNYQCYICGKRIQGSGVVITDATFSDDIEGGYQVEGNICLYACDDCWEEPRGK